MAKFLWSAALAIGLSILPFYADCQCVAPQPTANFNPVTAGGPENVWNPKLEGYLLRGALMYADGNSTGASDQLRMACKSLENAGGIMPGAYNDKECVAFLKALSAQAAGRKECVKMLESFVKRYPASSYRTLALLALGNHYFFSGQWGAASLKYAEAGLQGLNGGALSTYRYRYGLCLLKTGYFSEARTMMHSIAEDKNYRSAARFYLAFLDYAEGNYTGALKGFMDSGVASEWFEAQIAFEQGNWNKSASEAKNLYASLASASQNDQTSPGCPIGYNDEALYKSEMARVAGESYFKLGDYDNARTYLEKYASSPYSGAPSAYFDLGAIAYRNGDYDSCLELMDKATRDAGSIISENAWLYIGQCHARRGDNNAAAIAFENAWHTLKNPAVGETAMYDYIVALAKGGNVPFASSAGVMEQFLHTFPKSQYASEVNRYLATAYYIEKDYAKALDALDKIKTPGKQALATRQLVLYELGCLELSNGLSQRAAAHLQGAVDLKKYNEALAREAALWLGQAHYDNKNWKESQKATQTYIDSPAEKKNLGLALYDLAYAYYQEDNFKKSAELFAKAYTNPTLPPSLKNDALLRQADCEYYSGNYSKAYNIYTQAEKSGKGDNAYAAMRAAVMLGLKGDQAGKATGLEEMIKLYGNSKWCPPAMLELAEANKALGRIDKAENNYLEIARRWPDSPEAPQGYLFLSLLYASQHNNAKAIESFKELIRRWPGSEQAKSANTDLRRLMGDAGNLKEYVDFMNSIPGAPKVDKNEVEGIAFESAESRWAENASQTSGLLKYIADYPDGLYLAPALYELAYSDNEAAHYQQALDRIDEMIQKRPEASQITDALLLKAEILENHFPQRQKETLDVYRRIEQRGGSALTTDIYAGIMRLSDNAQERLQYARKVLSEGSLTSEQTQEATFYEAEALIALNRKSEGVASLEKLAANPSSLYGARAAVALGQYYLDNGNYAAAQKDMLAFTDKGTPHYYWLARGYIVLADAYAAEGHASTAREYINALKSNYPGSEADIQQMISSRLNKWK